MSELSENLVAALPASQVNGPEWFESLRKAGAEQFRAHGLPNRKNEAWKYTGLGSMDQADLKLSETLGKPLESAQLIPKPLVERDLRIEMLDGQFQAQIGELPEGLTVLPLMEALNHGVPGLKELLESLSGSQSNSGPSFGFSALNSATLDAGLVIHVAAGINAGKMSVSWSTGKGEHPIMVNSRVCVIVEQGGKLDLLEQFESLQESHNSSNVVLQAAVSEAAIFHHVRFQAESETAALITRTEVSQQSDSEYAYFGFDLGGGLVRHDLHTELLGPGAKTRLNGAYLLDGNRHVDNQARVDHMAPGGFSDQYFRGVAGGSGRAVFNTKVYVHPGADETEAKQSNANILLSARAEVDTKPELEIYADEVVASHGATVGQLDDKAVFYMRSRGLSESEARQMLTTAFCRSVSDKLTDPVLSEVISERMMAVMPQAE